MFNPPDGGPVLRLYKEPVKEETEDQRTIKLLRAQISEDDKVIAALEKKNAELESKLYHREAKQNNTLLDKFINAPKGVVLEPPKVGEKLYLKINELPEKNFIDNAEYFGPCNGGIGSSIGRHSGGGIKLKAGDQVTISLKSVEDTKHLKYSDGVKKASNGVTEAGLATIEKTAKNLMNGVNESMEYDPANNQLIYRDNSTGNIVRVISLRDLKVTINNRR